MKLDLYTFIYNDADILPFFLDYYSFVDRITFIDSGSNDGTLDLLNQFGEDEDYYPLIRICQTGLTWWDHNALHYYRNNIWKDTDYDMVLFPDCDEIFYHPEGLKNYIERTRNDVYAMEGYDMISDKFPAPGTKLTNIKTGMYFYPYHKSTLFNPACGIQFPNAHLRYTATTNINLGEVKLLHYRFLGLDFLKKRRDRERDRLPKDVKYRRIYTDKELKDWFNKVKSKSSVVI